MRPHLRSPYNGLSGASGLYTAAYFVKVSADQTWLQNAKQYETEYRDGDTPELLCSRRQYALVMKGILENIPPPDPPPSGLELSYVPNAQALAKPIHASTAGFIEVTDIGVGIEVVSRHLYIFGWIFKGKLAFRLVYNEAFYDRAFGERILALVKENLIENLRSSQL
ncbi:hypothetical protein GGS23DRAFT_617509 [Durotheca rogersii]|uniref:uncharacterized protein n=1 Tax=Durotheca rogersii TaxID=419775 RepID=UPI0022210FA3|nr:uncharacterized protein GGS23DRAFT_617509 [Durotheca rogersii]KAI5866393.1 hypothetical protein GGS23DRAFT_617509 [Durotheca rogersii]